MAVCVILSDGQPHDGVNADGAFGWWSTVTARCAAMVASPTLRRLWEKHACGDDFPADFAHISFVTLDELRHGGTLSAR